MKVKTISDLCEIENLSEEQVEVIKFKHELGVKLEDDELFTLHYLDALNRIRKIVNEQVAFTSAKGLCQEEEQRPQHPCKVGGKE